MLGFETVAAVEINPFCQSVLRARQADGCLDDFPIFEDVRTFDCSPWAGKVDVVTGGFPCQDVSIAGTGKGINGEKSSLWFEMWRIACGVRSPFLYLENSPALAMGRGLSGVLGALAEGGWDAEWVVLGAGHLGAPHARERLWLLAADADVPRREERWQRLPTEKRLLKRVPPWPSSSGICRVADGLAPIVDRRKRLHALGNGQVPRVAAAAFSILWQRLMRD